MMLLLQKVVNNLARRHRQRKTLKKILGGILREKALRIRRVLVVRPKSVLLLPRRRKRNIKMTYVQSFQEYKMLRKRHLSLNKCLQFAKKLTKLRIVLLQNPCNRKKLEKKRSIPNENSASTYPAAMFLEKFLSTHEVVKIVIWASTGKP